VWEAKRGGYADSSSFVCKGLLSFHFSMRRRRQWRETLYE